MVLLIAAFTLSLLGGVLLLVHGHALLGGACLVVALLTGVAYTGRRDR